MKKILIIDDHPDLREALRLLIGFMGFAGITAKNGKDGVDTAIAEKPDLIMMDFAMPEMDGFEATKILRAATETKKIPIIAVTAMPNIKSCIEVGCNDYIVKPFTPDKLLRKITALVQ
jgi:CheY-like chemotaxis protein